MFSTSATAITQLVALLTDYDNFNGVTIRDGGVVTAATGREAITIGFESEDAPGVLEGSFSFEGLGISRGRESYSINNAIHLLSGSPSDIPEQRVRAFTLLGYIAAVLSASPTLNGAVLNCKVGSWALSQSQSPRGPVTTLTFTIDCDGYTVATL